MIKDLEFIKQCLIRAFCNETDVIAAKEYKKSWDIINGLIETLKDVENVSTTI